MSRPRPLRHGPPPACGRSPLWWACCIGLSLSTAGCSSDKEEPTAPAPAAKPEGTATPAPEPVQAAAPSVDFDPATVPLQALSDLAAIELELGAGCATLLPHLQGSLTIVRDATGAMAELPGTEEARTALGALADGLHARAKDITGPASEIGSQRGEVDRLADELRSSLLDLAESTRLLGDAIVNGDTAAIAAMHRRIDNGVQNTQSSVERLSVECAP